ncbi:MAG: hypothetical protein EOM19_05170 [Candidatus Moranbacteria bacterium]|nr:hypothetical protein [Candidatus Moranbacteria bacterium]
MKNILFISIFSLLLFVPSFSSLALTECDEGYELVSGVCIPTDTGLPDPDPENPIWKVLDTFLRWILGILGLIAIIAFAVSGIMYLLSAGNENQIDKAKTYMVWSIVGVIVALLGFVIILAVDTWLRGYDTF